MTSAAWFLDQFCHRLLQDALTEATATYWRRRAAELEAAAHRPGVDWPGHATDAQLAAQRRRCLLTARACRQRAQLATWPEVHR